MSEESEAPKPSRLTLSSSKSQPEKQHSAPAPSSEVSSVKPIAELPPKKVEPPVTAPKPKLSPTPPPLAQKPAPRASEPVVKKVDETGRQMPLPPKKDNPLGSILIVAALLLILAAAGGGIWYLLRSDEPTATDEDAIPLEASPTNPVERAKATIATVPDRNLDTVLDTKSAPAPNDATAPAPQEAAASVATTEPLTGDLKQTVSQYLQNLHIGGVRTGARARIMLDGENYNINDTVDAATGLTFIGTRDQKLLFKDRDGIVYVKSF